MTEPKSVFGVCRVEVATVERRTAELRTLVSGVDMAFS